MELWLQLMWRLTRRSHYRMEGEHRIERCKKGLRTSKMSTEGWWMVQVIVRPMSTMFRTTRITTAAALASSPGRTHYQLVTPERLTINPSVP